MVSTKTPHTKQEMAQGAAKVPEGSRPWEDRTLPATERYQSYHDVARAKCEAIRDAGNRPGVTAAERFEISQDPEANHWVNEFRQLKGESAEQFCWRIDGGPQRELLGKNFLGAEAWAAQGIDVGAVPPLPAAITEALLNSECPLHPGEKIKDTHLLVLVPKTVNGEPYSALKLDELCKTRKGSGDSLMYGGDARWKSDPWSSTPQGASEWVLLPKSDPDPSKVSEERHFRWKSSAAQQAVQAGNYPEYREAKTIELLTAVVLYDLTHQERLVRNYYVRCEEPIASGGYVRVGCFFAVGLGVHGDFIFSASEGTGLALAWKL